MPSYRELCLHQKRRPFNIKKYTLRWPLMWEMHDLLIIFYLHCDIWNMLENIDWHYFCMWWIMRRSSFSRKFTKLVIIYQFKLILIILHSRNNWQILTQFHVLYTENKNIVPLCKPTDEYFYRCLLVNVADLVRQLCIIIV